MELQASKKLVEQVLNNSYDRSRYLELVGNLLKSYDQDNKSINILNSSHQFNNFTFLGSYQNSNKELGVYEVEVTNLKTLLNARVAQRNLIASELKKEGYDIGLASFYVKEQNQWRFSLITFESSIDLSSEKIKFIKTLSPSKRQSFLAGINEASHTAKKQLLNILQLKQAPTLDTIQKAFELEPVNNDFYEQYKELYLKLTDYLQDFIKKDEVIAKDFEEKEVLPSDFSKKTLGQFIFLYFIQKKGWIKNINNPESQFSLSELYENRFNYGDNFFNDLIEPIFYESLAKDGSTNNQYKVIKAFSIPYLNGGLFEPIRGYDWEKTNIIIPDSFFKNENKTKDGDIGDGLLDVFNRFNFTVFENDSLEQDIAVDPEMFGKVFEKLLPVKSRTDSGSFYTPKEIVKFMSQEVLINYLITHIGDEIPEEILKFFIINKSLLQYENINDSELSLIKVKAIDLDNLLAGVKVCDPAIGSGAFPMGLLNEIVSARSFLQHFLLNKKNSYDLKIHTIGQSLYGVDIDPSAVDIARLRFWLSLIIEQDQPTPLPNLDHKLMQGNSLLTKYKEIELFNDQFLEDADIRQEKIKLIDDELNLLEKQLREGFGTDLISQVKAIKDRLIKLNKNKMDIQNEDINIPNTQMLFENDDIISRIKKQVSILQLKISNFLLLSDKDNKKELKKEIDEIKWNLIEASVENESDKKLFKQITNQRIQPFFLWKLEFIDVFRGGGFDIVIGNPPYIMEDENKEAFDGLHSHPCYQGKTDIWHLFTGTGLTLLKENGFLMYVAKNQWLCSSSAAKMREEIYRNSHLKTVVDFGSNMIFDSADQQTMIMLLQKNKNNATHQIEYIKFDGIFKLNNLFQNLLDRSFNSDQLFVANKSIPKNFDKNENLTFSSKKNELILNKIDSKSNFKFDPDNEIIQGIIGGPDKAFILGKEDLENFNEIEKSFIRMLHTNSGRFSTPDTDKYILYLNKKIFNNKKIDDCPNINNKLSIYKESLINRREVRNKRIEWFHLWWPRDEFFFKSGPKLVWAKRTEGKRFTYTEKPLYGTANMFFIKSERVSLKYIAALLNSELFYFYMNERLKHTGDLLQLDKNQFTKIPIFIPENINKFEIIVDQIIENKEHGIETNDLEIELDKLVYNIFQLTDEEIKFIKNIH